MKILVPKGVAPTIRKIQEDNAHYVSSESLVPFVREMIAPGSVVCTDGWRGYYGLSDGYEHHQTILSSSDDPAHVAMPGVHRVASLLKRWLPGTPSVSLASIIPVGQFVVGH